MIIGNGPEFKSWTRLFAFHMVLIHLGKVCIQLFTFQLWVNSRTDWLFNFDMATSLRERKQNPNCLRIDLVSQLAQMKGLYIYIYIYIYIYTHTHTHKRLSIIAEDLFILCCMLYTCITFLRFIIIIIWVNC